MTRDAALGELDQLIAEAKSEACFGDTSDTVSALRRAYAVGCREAEMYDENEPRDTEEFRAAHECGRRMEAKAITEGRL